MKWSHFGLKKYLFFSIFFFFVCIRCLIVNFILKIHTGYLLFFTIYEKKRTFIDFSLIFDWISLKFFFYLLIIVFSVYLFSLDYLEKDYFYYRFIGVLRVFVLSMIFLIFTPHFIFMLVG